MDTTIVLISVFAIFIPALILPGPDFVAVVRSSMSRGTIAGLLTSIGVTIGLGLYASLSLLGLSAILVEYQWLSWLVRIAGGSYLVYLGLRLLWAKPRAVSVNSECDSYDSNPLIFGFFVTLTNPKAMVLFASVFATSVTSHTPDWLLVLMIVLVMTSAFAWYAAVAMFMSSRPVMRRFESSQHWIERAAGVCFIAIGSRVISDARNPVTP
ncbi:MAG: LysE family translocator [Hyphomicrobiaceae bacterium]